LLSQDKNESANDAEDENAGSDIEYAEDENAVDDEEQAIDKPEDVANYGAGASILGAGSLISDGSRKSFKPGAL
jgi:hypothetical protein